MFVLQIFFLVCLFTLLMIFFFLEGILRIEPKTSCVLSTRSASKLYPLPSPPRLRFFLPSVRCGVVCFLGLYVCAPQLPVFLFESWGLRPSPQLFTFARVFFEYLCFILKFQITSAFGIYCAVQVEEWAPFCLFPTAGSLSSTSC